MVTIGDAVQGTVLFLKDLRGVDDDHLLVGSIWLVAFQNFTFALLILCLGN